MVLFLSKQISVTTSHCTLSGFSLAPKSEIPENTLSYIAETTLLSRGHKGVHSSFRIVQQPSFFVVESNDETLSQLWKLTGAGPSGV